MTFFPDINEKVVDRIIASMQDSYIPSSDSPDINIDSGIDSFGRGSISKLVEVFKIKPTWDQIKSYLDACPNCELRCAGHKAIEYGVNITNNVIGVSKGEVITIYLPYDISDTSLEPTLRLLSIAMGVDKLVILGDILDLWTEPQTYKKA